MNPIEQTEYKNRNAEVKIMLLKKQQAALVFEANAKLIVLAKTRQTIIDESTAKLVEIAKQIQELEKNG